MTAESREQHSALSVGPQINTSDPSPLDTISFPQHSRLSSLQSPFISKLRLLVMPVRHRDRADVGGPSSSSSSSHRGWDQDIKPSTKAKTFSDNVIDLCDSDDDEIPRRPARSRSTSKPKRSAGPNGKPKYNDDDRCSPSRSPNSSDDDDDDFQGSSAKRFKKPTSSKTDSSTPKLYAMARIATLATDGVESISESEAKLAGINPASSPASKSRSP